MMDNMRRLVTQQLAHVQLRQEEPNPFEQNELPEMHEQHANPNTGENEAVPNDTDATQNAFGKVPRNAPCPCGSGKKFKHCQRQVELITFQKSDKNPAKIDQSWREFFYVRAKRPSMPMPNGRFLSVLTRIIQLDRRKITTSNTGIVNTYNDCFHPKNQKRYKTSTISSG